MPLVQPTVREEAATLLKDGVPGVPGTETAQIFETVPPPFATYRLPEEAKARPQGLVPTVAHVVVTLPPDVILEMVPLP